MLDPAPRIHNPSLFPELNMTLRSQSWNPTVPGKSLIIIIRIAVLALVLIYFPGAARAHDPGLSAVEVRFQATKIDVRVSLAHSDIESVANSDADGDGLLSPGELNIAGPRVTEFARSAVALAIDDRMLAPVSVDLSSNQPDSFAFQITYEREDGSRLRISSSLIALLPNGHRQYLTIFDDRGIKLGEKLFSAAANHLEVDLVSASQARSVLQFAELGIEHILKGYDHLVFLFGLLLAGACFKDLAKVITSFTAAHSITLALSTLGFARIPSEIVEPMIAISIVYIGLENLFRKDLKWRWLLTFGFGLIHGFGFASALQDLGIGVGSDAALPLVAFNSGVELGQLMIATVALPLIWKLRRRPIFVARFTPACSILISVAGGFWLLERLLGA